MAETKKNSDGTITLDGHDFILVPIDKFGEGKAPPMKGDGFAIWGSRTKDGKPYLSGKVLSTIPVAAFPNEKRE